MGVVGEEFEMVEDGLAVLLGDRLLKVEVEDLEVVDGWLDVVVDVKVLELMGSKVVDGGFEVEIVLRVVNVELGGSDVVMADLLVETLDAIVLLIEVMTLLLEELVARGTHVAPKAVTSLKSSVKVPLDTPNLAPITEDIATVAL